MTAPTGYMPVPGSTAGLYHRREGDHFVYWHPTAGRSSSQEEPVTPQERGKRLGYLLEHHRDAYQRAYMASNGETFDPRTPSHYPKRDLAGLVHNHETAAIPEHIAKVWARLPAEHRVHAPSEIQRDQERAEDLQRIGGANIDDELKSKVRHTRWDEMHAALADPSDPDHADARALVQKHWGEVTGPHSVMLASLKRTAGKPVKAKRLTPQDKALDKLHAGAVGAGFAAWAQKDDPDRAEEGKKDASTRREHLHEYLQAEHGINIRDDGNAEFERLTGPVRRILGDHPVVLHHHTSSKLRARVKREGLHTGGEMVNPHLNTRAGIYVTTENSGPAVTGYQRNAVAHHGGHAHTFEVRTTIPDLDPDPDDAELSALHGRQFVLPHVRAEDILNKSTAFPALTLLALLAKASGQQVSLFGRPAAPPAPAAPAGSSARAATATHQVHTHIAHTATGKTVVVQTHTAHHKPGQAKPAPPAPPARVAAPPTSALTDRDVFRMGAGELQALAGSQDKHAAALAHAEIARRAAKRGRAAPPDAPPQPLPSVMDAPPSDALEVSAVAPTEAVPAVDEDPASRRAKAFHAWFGDSKVRAADGQAEEQHGPFNTGLVVYHGTVAGGFSAFDPNFDKGQNIYGRGFYFTADKEIATEYMKKDEDALAAQARGFLDGHGKPVLTLTEAQATALMLKHGFARKAGVAGWSTSLDDYDKVHDYNAGHGRNGNWSGNVQHAVSAAANPDGSVDLGKLWGEFRRPTTAEPARVQQPKTSWIGDIKPEMDELARKVVGGDILKAIGADARPDVPASQLYAVYLSIKKPLDMNESVDPAALQRLATHLAKDEFHRSIQYLRDDIPHIESKIQQHKTSAHSARFERGAWVTETDQARKERIAMAVASEMTTLEGAKRRLATAEAKQASIERGEHVKHAVYADDIITRRDRDLIGDDSQMLPIDHNIMLKLKQRTVDDTKGKQHEGRQIAGIYHITPRDTLTWGDVQFMLTNGQHGRDGSEMRGLRAWAEGEGYDGIRHKGGWNIGTKEHDVYIAWKPEAIKATTAKDFDPTTTDLYKAQRARRHILALLSGQALAKASPPGVGWERAPKSRKGTFRRRVGNKWEYWDAAQHSHRDAPAQAHEGKRTIGADETLVRESVDRLLAMLPTWSEKLDEKGRPISAGKLTSIRIHVPGSDGTKRPIDLHLTAADKGWMGKTEGVHRLLVAADDNTAKRVEIALTVPTQLSITSAAGKMDMRRVLAHELAHAIDPRVAINGNRIISAMRADGDHGATRRTAIEEREPVKYYNDPVEVTAFRHNIFRELNAPEVAENIKAHVADHPTTGWEPFTDDEIEDIATGDAKRHGKEHDEDFKAGIRGHMKAERDLPYHGGPRADHSTVLQMLRQHSPTWKRIEAHLTPANRRKVLESASAVLQHHVAGTSHPMEKSSAGPFIGPKGGKWADPEHTIPWEEPHAGATHTLRLEGSDKDYRLTPGGAEWHHEPTGWHPVRNLGIIDQLREKAGVSPKAVKVSAPVEPEHKPAPDPDNYKLGHRPAKGAVAHALGTGEIMPKDVVTHPDRYTGFPDQLRSYWPKLKAAQGKPNATIKMYRALPKASKGGFNHGDWVTLSRKYAEDHAHGENDWHVIEAEVPVHELHWPGDDLAEWGYWGSGDLKKSISRPDRLRGGRADGMSPDDFDAAALAHGTGHEREHTDDAGIAQEIAMDHLATDPHYYTKIEAIEKAAQASLFGGGDLQHIKAHLRQTTHGPVMVAPHVRHVRHFASGSQSPGEPTGFAQVGKDVGVAALDVSPRVEAELKSLAGKDAAVFVDSGAFSEVTFGPSGPEVVRPFTAADWERVIGLYERLAPVLKDQLHVVAPDRIGDQTETLARLTRYADRMKALRSHGVNILVPIQQGQTPMADFDRQVEAIMGDDGYIPAIPSKKDATPVAALVAYLKDRHPARIHLLGIGPDSPKASGLLDSIARASPETAVQMDSNVIRAAVGRGAPGTTPRAYTTGQDRAREDIQDAAYDDGLANNIGRDFTEEIGEPSLYMGPVALRRFAADANMDAATTRRFLKEPDEVINEPMDGDMEGGGPSWSDVYHDTLEQAWRDHIAETTGFERRRRAIHYAWGTR